MIMITVMKFNDQNKNNKKYLKNRVYVNDNS